jgi:hypothetical protein
MNYVQCYRLDSGIEMFENDIMMKNCRDSAAMDLRGAETNSRGAREKTQEK